MPCGTGKSLAAYWIAEALTSRHSLTPVKLLLVRRSVL
jgi:hypothetical protein